jgi:NTE family protein
MTMEPLSNPTFDSIRSDRSVRTTVAYESHYWFFNLYFSQYVQYETAPFQRELFEVSENDQIKLAVIVAFRGSGKSTIMTLSYPIWAVIGKQQKKFVLILSQTQAQARQHLVNLKRELEGNELLRADLGPLEEQSDEWGITALVLPKYGAKIMAASSETSIRGLRHGQYRPDLIVADDVEDLNSVKTREGRAKTFDWFSGEVIPCGDTYTKILVVGNLLHEDSLLMKLRKSMEEKRLRGTFMAYPLVDGMDVIAWPGKFRTMDDIVGPGPYTPHAGAFVFHRSDFNKTSAAPKRIASIVPMPSQTRQRRIGLALSGGGSRAIAFHLGCLRALHDRGCLVHVDVVSAVSGGSVIAGMYAYSNDRFGEFDARVVSLLRHGLLGSVVRRTFLSRHLPAILATALLSGAAAFAADLARGSLGSRFKHFSRVRPPWVRWVSRTSALEAALRDLLFSDALVTAPRRNDIQVVINACELRTGTAFRFGNIESSCWRFGKISGNRVRISEAVAASAAYPVILPAIDRIFTFEDRQGRETMHRVLLTDGGVYDNLGTSCLEPGRSTEFGYPPCELEYVIACDAGGGQFGEENLPYGWPARMIRSFETVFRMSQNGSRSRLHQYAASGQLKGFIMPYLGQQDSSLDYQPPDLVRRDEVKDYPTNFSPMKQRDIDLLALRGEQLTRLLLDRYCPEL